MEKVCEYPECSKVFKARSSVYKYCCSRCSHDHKIAKTREKWLAGGKVHGRTIKSFLIADYGNKCSCCGIEDWQGIPIVFELEHKDGNSENKLLDNLCLLCPNCHSQTPTYKGRNTGNGRHSRRERYAQGKSY